MKDTLPIRLNYEFKRVYKRGKYIPGRYVVLHFIHNNTDKKRVGISTGKKIKGSVSRNRMRRLLRETYRLLEDKIRPGYDIILLGRDNPLDLKQSMIQKDVTYLFKKAKILKEDTRKSSFIKEQTND